MGNRSSFFEYSLMELESADPIEVLQQLSKNHISVSEVTLMDTFTVRFRVQTRHVKAVIRLLSNRTESCRIVKKSSMRESSDTLFRRPILLCGICLLILLSLFLPSRVLFIRVEGNDTVPARKILEAAADCGIRFGASRKAIRSEKVKNALIARIPQLKWVGVNTTGCIATLSVQESIEEQSIASNHPVGNIVAGTDGVILSYTSVRGTPVCRPGQAVTKGQLLISGYTDCGIYVQATCAEGEILAQTSREISVLSPKAYHYRQELLETRRQYRIKIGNYLINLFKGSGISDATCVKIYEEKNLHLPGGFCLPVSLICEEYVIYEHKVRDSRPAWLEESAREYLKKHMVAGTIISEEIHIKQVADMLCLYGRYDCTEMIGQLKLEVNGYGDDGENR